MTTPWPNAAFAQASSRSNDDQVVAPARPAEIVEAHLYQAKSQMGSMLLMLAFGFGHLKSAIDVFAGQNVLSISENLVSILSMGLGVGVASGMVISLYLLVKTLLSPDFARFIELAPHPYKSVTSRTLVLAICVVWFLAFVGIYFGVEWATSQGILANGMGDVVRACLFLLLSSHAGWTAWLHLKRAREINATL